MWREEAWSEERMIRLAYEQDLSQIVGCAVVDVLQASRGPGTQNRGDTGVAILYTNEVANADVPCRILHNQELV